MIFDITSDLLKNTPILVYQQELRRIFRRSRAMVGSLTSCTTHMKHACHFVAHRHSHFPIPSLAHTNNAISKTYCVIFTTPMNLNYLFPTIIMSLMPLSSAEAAQADTLGRVHAATEKSESNDIDHNLLKIAPAPVKSLPSTDEDAENIATNSMLRTDHAANHIVNAHEYVCGKLTYRIAQFNVACQWQRGTGYDRSFSRFYKHDNGKIFYECGCKGSMDREYNDFEAKPTRWWWISEPQGGATGCYSNMLDLQRLLKKCIAELVWYYS